MKKRFALLFIFLLSLSIAIADEHDEPIPDLVSEEAIDIYEDVGDVEIQEKAGITPDSPFYFLDKLGEAFAGDDPETALKIKEEKIREAEQMIRDGKIEEAKVAFERARIYGEKLEREVSPEIEKRARESSKAVKKVIKELDIEDEELKDLVIEQEKIEDEIALAAKISTEIQVLCKRLSKLDPKEYSRVCKTEDNDAKWKRKLDEELSKEQREEAEDFFGIMSQCRENPRECPCEKIKIKSFSEKCSKFAPIVADCDAGDEEACEKLDNMQDPIDLLPPHLQRAMEKMHDDYREKEFEHRLPPECEEAGANKREDCEKIMFKLQAPIECVEAFENGKIDASNQREAHKKCEELMFKLNSPPECIEAGLTDGNECQKLMFRLDSPQECLDAGLTGEGRNDWQICNQIRFKLEAPQACLDAGLTGEGRNDWNECGVIEFKNNAPEICLDGSIDPTDRRAWDKCNLVQFNHDAPQECLEAGLTGAGRRDWEKCDAIKREIDENFVPEQPLEIVECPENEVRVCESGFCKCISKKDYDDSRADQGFTVPENDIKVCGDCQQECPGAIRTNCNNGYCECFYEEQINQCKDGCLDECPGASKTSCRDGYCECFYDQQEPIHEESIIIDEPTDPPPEPPAIIDEPHPDQPIEEDLIPPEQDIPEEVQPTEEETPPSEEKQEDSTEERADGTTSTI